MKWMDILRSMIIGTCVAAGMSATAATNATPKAADVPAKPQDYRLLLQRVRAKQQEKNGLDELQKAVSAFQIRFGRFPSELRELVDRGVLAELPSPPQDTRFFYDRSVGNVRLIPLSGSSGTRTNLPGAANLVTQPK